LPRGGERRDERGGKERIGKMEREGWE